MVRLYPTAFQAVQRGLSVHNRYAGYQLQGQMARCSGKALILPRPSRLGCTPSASAGSSSSRRGRTSHPAPRARAETSEVSLCILDPDKGKNVHIHHGRKHTGGDEFALVADAVSCSPSAEGRSRRTPWTNIIAPPTALSLSFLWTTP